MNENLEKKIVILILNWNKRDFVLKLLDQIHNIEYKNYECLVVDNNSDDNSVSEIKSLFPNIKIVQNSENLGGTGGYNSGLKYVLNNIECDYIWLIDNDAEIQPDTLTSLVKIMDKDEKIGIAGSRIIDINNKDTTIELGSFVKWDTIGVKPNLRNKKIEKFGYDHIETDYVAICSALVRANALTKVGLMDERHFIFWDDMDWGLQFRKNNFKVVAVPGSIAYHPSFTERKRGIITDYYYGLRNPLLVYSKHTTPLLRLKIFSVFFLNYSMFLALLLFNRRWESLKFAYQAIHDFVFNNWGKCSLKQKINETKIEMKLSDIKLNKILIIFDTYTDDGFKIIEELKTNFSDVKTYALIDKDREDIYQAYFDNIISVDSHKRRISLLYNIKTFIRIIKLNFDLAIGSNASPFGYAVKNYCIFNDGIFERTDIKINNIYKVILSSIIGLVLSFFITTLVFLSSFRYSRI